MRSPPPPAAYAQMILIGRSGYSARAPASNGLLSTMIAVANAPRIDRLTFPPNELASWLPRVVVEKTSRVKRGQTGRGWADSFGTHVRCSALMGNFAERIQFPVVRRRRVDGATTDHHDPVVLRARDELLHRSRPRQHEVGGQTDGDAAVLRKTGDVGRSKPEEAKPWPIGMIQVQDARRLAKHLQHVEVAIGIERVAGIVARDRDRNPGGVELE